MRGRRWLLLACALVAVVTALVPAARASFAGENGKIAFSLGNDLFDPGPTPRPGIYVIEGDGSGQARIAGSRTALLAWSPDGRSLAFSAYRWGRRDLFVMRADGSGVRRLTRSAATEERPAWSPDGRWLAFQRSERTPIENGYAERPADIYVVRPDGQAVTNLTQSKEAEGPPVWSPDGTRIAFVRYPAGGEVGNGADFDIYLASVDGGRVRRLFESSRLGAHSLGNLAWSPEGARLAFEVVFLTEEPASIARRQLYTIDARTGRDARRLSGDHDRSPQWSPDGAKIAFLRARVDVEGPPDWIDVFVMNRDGSGQMPLTNSQHSRYDLTWSPDGRKLAYAEGDEGTSLGVTEADGSGESRTLTPRAVGNAILGAFSLDWQPLVAPPPPAIRGTSRRDEQAGTRGADTIRGLGGNDVIRAREGGDTAYGGEGADALLGGSGADILYGEEGADRLQGGSGWDTLLGGFGNDRIFARDGRRDWIFCGAGRRDFVRADPFDLIQGCEFVRWS